MREGVAASQNACSWRVELCSAMISNSCPCLFCRHIPEQEQQQQHQEDGGEISPALPSYAAVTATGTPAAAAVTAAAGGSTAQQQGAVAQPLVPPERKPQLCILALPPDMGFAELCAFMGAYFQLVSLRCRRGLAARAGGCGGLGGQKVRVAQVPPLGR